MSDTAPEPDLESRAEHLKERVYVTFTALAVVLTLREHAESPGRAISTLLIAVLATVMAVFVADVISHVAVHAALPTGPEIRHMAQVSFGAIAVVVLPMVFLAFAAADRWEVEQALRAATIALVASLVAVAYLAVRRVKLPPLQRAIVLLAEFVLAGLVVAIELAAH